MKAVRLSRTLIVVIVLVASLGANVTLFVGGVLYSFVDKFVEEAFDLATAAGKQRKALVAQKKKNTALQAENKKLQKQLKKVGKVAGSAADRSRARLLRSASRSVATAPAKAVPVAGALVVAGLTVMEVKDLCETMRDMDRIKRVVDAPEAGAESEPAICPVPVPSREQLLERIEGSAQEAWDESMKYVPHLPGWDDISESLRDVWRSTIPDTLRDTWDYMKRLSP